MPRRSTFPGRWIEALIEHSESLHRVQLMWRRGGRSYTPIIPLSNCPADPREEPRRSYWDAYETEDTHFQWVHDDSQSWTERRATVEEIVDELVVIGADWVEHLNCVCDLCLYGYDRDDHELLRVPRRFVPDSAKRLKAGDVAPSRPEGPIPFGVV